MEFTEPTDSEDLLFSVRFPFFAFQSFSSPLEADISFLCLSCRMCRLRASRYVFVLLPPWTSSSLRFADSTRLVLFSFSRRLRCRLPRPVSRLQPSQRSTRSCRWTSPPGQDHHRSWIQRQHRVQLERRNSQVQRRIARHGRKRGIQGSRAYQEGGWRQDCRCVSRSISSSSRAVETRERIADRVSSFWFIAQH